MWRPLEKRNRGERGNQEGQPFKAIPKLVGHGREDKAAFIREVGTAPATHKDGPSARACRGARACSSSLSSVGLRQPLNSRSPSLGGDLECQVPPSHMQGS